MPPVIPPPRSSGFTRTTDVPLHWVAYGEPGKPRLLVLHGGPGAHHDYLLPQMLRLAERYELVLYDQRGGGRSKTGDRALIGWRTHVEDLGRVIAEMQLAPPTLVGYSWGALLALLYALDAFEERSAAGDLSRRGSSHNVTPGLTPPARMVLIDPAPVSRQLREQFEAEFARRQGSVEVSALRDELAASGLRERDPEEYRQRLFEIGVAGYFAEPARARDLTPFRVVGRVQQSVWESLGDFDLVPRLGAVRCPTLVVHGRQDPIPLVSSELITRAMPSAQLTTLERSGHVPYVEQPDALFNAIFRFLDDTAALARSAIP